MLKQYVAKYSYVNGIFVDIEEDAKEIGKSRYPYGETMHEIGHHVDASIASKLQTDQCDASSMYISKIYGCTLDEMFKKEANQYFAKIRKKQLLIRKPSNGLKKNFKDILPRIAMRCLIYGMELQMVKLTHTAHIL